MKKEPTIGFCTFEKYEGRKDIGSSRIRAKWVTKYWDEAEIFVQGRKYETVIYQKAYWIEHAKVFEGVKIFDLCDADFMHWGYRTKEIIDNVDVVTTSTEELAKVIRRFTDKPVIFIPDRVDLEYYNKRKIHSGDAKKVVWYGYSNNFDLVRPAINFLIKEGIEKIIVISDKDVKLQADQVNKIDVEFYKWKIETVNDNILKGDIVINPYSVKGKWKFKSNNKTVGAWALGMPVATNVEELRLFVSQKEREKEANKRIKEVKDKYDVRLSVKDYKNVINKIL